MPMYDRKCQSCGDELIDCWEPINHEAPNCFCGGKTERVWLHGKVSGVIGDECDTLVRHGLCNSDGSPRHYRFKSEMKAEAKRRGLTNYDTHVGTPGSDKSPHTNRWT